jgi:ATP-dependent helicase HrpA
LRYQFEPGTSADGVTVDVPVATLNQVDPTAFTWQVPGLREELVVALIRSLPKQLRVNFVPAPNVAKEFLAVASPGEESLLEALGRFLRGRSGVHVSPEAWDWGKVPGHLRPTFRVVDERGQVVGAGKDLERLKEPLRPKFQAAMAEAASSSGLDVTGATSWTFGGIERTFTQTRAGHDVRGFPGLVDEGSSVGLRVFGSERERDASHLRGLRRLLMLAIPSPARAIAEGLSNAEKLSLAGSPYPSVADLLEDCVAAGVDDLVTRHGGPVWDEPSFTALTGAVRADLTESTRSVMYDVVRVLASWRDVDKALTGSVDMTMLPALADLKAQVGRLVRRGFVGEAGVTWLRHYPRYLAAVAERRTRLPGGVARDRQLMDQVAGLQEAYLHRLEALPDGRLPSAELRRVGWMLEEYRVSLWAQSLGTSFPVSDTRIRKALDQA